MARPGIIAISLVLLLAVGSTAAEERPFMCSQGHVDSLTARPSSPLGPTRFGGDQRSGSRVVGLAGDSGLVYEGSTLWTPFFDFCVCDTLVYVATGEGIMVLDIRQADSIRTVSQVYIGTWVINVAVHDTLLAVGLYNSGVQVYGISDPVSPHYLGYYDCLHYYDCGLEMYGDTAYVGTMSGLEIVDCSNPLDLNRLALIELHPNNDGVVSCVIRRDAVLFVGAGFTWIYDVSDIAHPEVISQIGDPEDDQALAFDLALRDSLLFVSRKSAWIPSVYSYLTVVDIGSLQAPQLLASERITGYTYDLELIGDRLIVGTELSGTLLFDVSNPLALILIDCLFVQILEFSEPWIDQAERIHVADDRIFVAHRAMDFFDEQVLFPIALCSSDTAEQADTLYAGSDLIGGDFAALSLSDSDQFVVDGVYEGHPYPITLDVEGRLAVVGMAWSDLAVVDISDPSDMRVLSQIKPPAYTNDMAIDGQWVYLANAWDGLRVIDISDPTRPVVTGHVPRDTIGSAYSVAAFDGGILLGNNTGVLYAIGVADSSDPRLLSSYSTGGLNGVHCVVAGAYAYVSSERTNVLHIVDVSDPGNIRQAATYTEPQMYGSIGTLAVRDTMLVAQIHDLIAIYSIAIPTAPVLVGRYTPSDYPQNISIGEDNLFIATLYGTVERVDISDPTNPRCAGIFTDPLWTMHQVKAANGLVYGVDGYSLFALRPDGGSAVNDPVGELPLPNCPQLSANYPNPFNPSTTIPFSLPYRQHTRLDVFNITGQRVATLVDREFPAGEHSVQWNGCDADGRPLATGVYLYRLTTEHGVTTRKMMLLK